MSDKKMNSGSVVALGNFDGLHKGHAEVLKNAIRFSENTDTKAIVVLFDSHPRKVLFGEKVPKIMTNAECEKALINMGFEIHRLSFSEIMNESPEEFFSRHIVSELNAKAVCCGFNYTFGKFGEGNDKTLKKLCEEKGIECLVADEITVGGETVSSTNIKTHLENGETEIVTEMLGRRFSFAAPVIEGDKRGRTINLPTINQRISSELILPKFGVYESRISLDGKEYKGVTNIGIRPTYVLDTAMAETNILSFSGNLYGKEIKIELVRFLRREKKFNNIDELKNQIEHDIREVEGNV